MANILYLVHRIPYPPNKGDKVRSYHLLTHLAASHRIFLATFIDDPDDEKFIPVLENLCVSSFFVRMNHAWSKINSLRGILNNSALTVNYYKNDKLQSWVNALMERHQIDCAVVFSSSMAQYVENIKQPCFIDFVDVDSFKWTEYAVSHSWPLSWLYKREGYYLLQYEHALTLKAAGSFFVTENELKLFLRLLPGCGLRAKVMNNGVDTDYFIPRSERFSPFPEGQHEVVVFTGAMDYLPNIDAVVWFVEEILPLVRKERPNVLFYIVGRNPSEIVKKLASNRIVITGTVSDVRPYLQFADVVVAPLRIARGIQNKILEAMAMGRPVVAAKACACSINIGSTEIVMAADTASEYLEYIKLLLESPELAQRLGELGRQHVLEYYTWSQNMSVIDPFLDAALLSSFNAHVTSAIS